MKRRFALLLCFALLLSFAACGNGQPGNTDPGSQTGQPTAGSTSTAGCTHEYTDANCTAPKTCTICGATDGEKGDHSWVEATCKAPKTCTVCGKTEGESTEHSWTDDTCSATCTICGVKTDAKCPDYAACDACGNYVNLYQINMDPLEAAYLHFYYYWSCFGEEFIFFDCSAPAFITVEQYSEEIGRSVEWILNAGFEDMVEIDGVTYIWYGEIVEHYAEYEHEADGKEIRFYGDGELVAVMERTGETYIITQGSLLDGLLQVGDTFLTLESNAGEEM